MERITIKSPEGASAEVTPYAAHIVSWKLQSGKELLFVSKRALYEPPKAIRGGVPICFPQFGAYGPLGQHGFARNSLWAVENQTASSVKLALSYDGKQHEKFSHPFVVKTEISLSGEALTQTLEVTNTGSGDMPFTAALHTYFRVCNIANVRVTSGLQGITYLDSLDGKKEKQEGVAPVVLEGEVDRIYINTPDTVEIQDSGAGHTFIVTKEGFPDAVLWNPHVAKAQAMADFGDDEWQEMVCLEPAVAPSGPVSLAPGKTWSAKQVLAVKALSHL